MIKYLDDRLERFNKLLQKDRTNEADLERKALFFIFAGNIELYSKVNYIYDFKNHSIEPDFLEKVDFCSSSQALIRLGFNLFNGRNPADVLDVFSVLDKDNFKLALAAIEVRFGKRRV